MPFSIPTMYLLNRIRQVSPPLTNAKSLSNIWWMRFGGYATFGSFILLSNNHTPSSPLHDPTYGFIKY
ncbi:MAG: hypothetical protein ACR2M9_00400 [Cyanophyceae cyanobacterium]